MDEEFNKCDNTNTEIPNELSSNTDLNFDGNNNDKSKDKADLSDRDDDTPLSYKRDEDIKGYDEETGKPKLTMVYNSDNETDYTDLSDSDNDNDPYQSSNGSDEDNQYKSEFSSRRDNKNCNDDQKNLKKEDGDEMYNQKQSGEYITIDRCLSIIKAVTFGIDKNEICEMFNCSKEQIEQFLHRSNNIMEFCENNQAGNISRPLSLEDRINVNKTYNRYKISYKKLSWIFNCSKQQIGKSILNRNTLIEDYKNNHPDFDDSKFKSTTNRISKTLSLEERMDVLKAYDHNNYTCYKLSCMFNCSKGQIENILFNRKSVIEEYKKKYPDFHWNDLKVPNYIDKTITKSRYVNILTLVQCAEVIASYDHDKNYSKLGRLYNCGVEQIKSIIRNREAIMKTYEIYQNSGSHLNDVESNTREKKTTPHQIHIFHLGHGEIAEIEMTIFHSTDSHMKYHIDIDSGCSNKTSNNEFPLNVETSVENLLSTQNTDKSNGGDNHKNLNDFFEDDAFLKDKEFSAQQEKTRGVNDKVNTNYELPDTCKTPSKNKGDGDNVKSLHDNTPCRGKLGPSKYVNVIEAYDQKTTIAELTRKFNCSESLINDILKNRLAILKTFDEPIKTQLSLYKRIEVIRTHICYNYTYHKLSMIFNCSLKEIKLCIQNREHYIQKYKNQHPELNENKYEYKTLTLEERVQVINAFYQYPDIPLLAHWFGCPQKYIIKITAKRDEIMKKYLKEVNISKSLIISTHNDITFALKPIKTYAELIHNSTAINIMLELDEHLQSYIPKMNQARQINFEVSSYADAFNALKPIGEFAKLTNNCDAKSKILLLGTHFIQNM